ncbi:MAG: hypothetical protein GY797_21245 [Deltaproteobacteria bacterium]|nr:hypothetical protein [Deltaproteobacteria bacterium]
MANKQRILKSIKKRKQRSLLEKYAEKKKELIRQMFEIFNDIILEHV